MNKKERKKQFEEINGRKRSESKLTPNKKIRELYTSLHHQQHIVFMRISKKATSKRKSSFNNV